MATPRIGAPELVSAQATPETTVNEQVRYLEQGASQFIVKDKDLATPPGSPSDGDAYIVAATATGAWAGNEKKIAFYMTSAWLFITPVEGTRAEVQDEDKVYRYSGSAWAVSPLASDNLAVAADIWEGTSTAKAVTPDALQDAAAPTALTSSTSITPDFNAGLNFTLTLGHNATLENPTNPQPGDSGVIEITQDGTGGRTMAFASSWKFPSGAPMLSTGASDVDALVYYVAATNRILANLTKDYSS